MWCLWQRLMQGPSNPRVCTLLSNEPNERQNLQMTNLRNQVLSNVANDLRDVQTKKFDVLARPNAAKDDGA